MPPTLDSAQTALNSTKRCLNDHKDKKIDKVFEAYQPSEVSAVKDTTMQLYSAIKSQIGTFVQSSEGLMRVLDEIGKVHPYIQVAVIPFKAALALELKRLNNDKKVLALFVQMNDMMSNLRLLEAIKPDELGEEGIGIADRMDGQLRDAAAAIQDCSHATHNYYQTKVIVKLLKSNSWEDKFTEFTSTFVSLADDFNSIIGLYTGIGVQTTHRVTERLDGKLDLLMKLIFKTLIPPRERELTRFIDAKGGPNKFVDDDGLLRELLHKREAQLSRSNKPGASRKGTKSVSFIDIKNELKNSLDKSLAESKRFFSQKFEEQKNQILEVKSVVRHESDRIIYEILSGPKDRILDKAMYIMWVEMGWKGSAKPLDVVLAIRDFYSGELLQVTKDTKNPESTSSTVVPTTPPQMKDKYRKTRDLLSDLPALTNDDVWAISCINNVRLRPLQEALDPDCSDFVTINELNEFTSARPHDWSLPLWFAYWTSGFEVTIRQYTSRIRAVFSDINSVYDTLIVGNANAYSKLVNSFTLMDMDMVVAAVHTLPSEDLASDYPHIKFQEYAAEIESRVEKKLKQFNYFIDERNTLSLVIGTTGYLEEYILPLVYLILRRIRSIINKGKTQILTDSDFYKPLTSLETLRFAISERAEFLKGIFKLRNLNVNEELRRYCYALYYFVAVGWDNIDSEMSYYNLPDATYDLPYSDLNGESDNEEEPSRNADRVDAEDDDYHEQDADIKDDQDDIEAAMEMSLKLETLSWNYLSASDQSPNLAGVWYGFYHYADFYTLVIDGVMGIHINSVNEDRTFVGKGNDSLAGFAIKGNLNGNRISFIKEYNRLIKGHKTKWFYAGTINDSLDVITGKWGETELAETESAEKGASNSNNKEDEDDSDSDERTGLDFLGTFMIHKKPVEYVHYRPSDEVFEENKPRALWKFARDAIMNLVSRRVLIWSALKRRRDNRRRFISLWMEYQEQGLQTSADYDEFEKLQKQLSAVDLRLYRHLAGVLKSRRIEHQAYCDSCSKSYILMTRYMCLTCSEGHSYATVDICADCIDKEFTAVRNNGEQELNHVPSHPLLQIRRPFTLRDQYLARESAKSTTSYALDATQEVTELNCDVCKKRITEMPYWSCCTCFDLYVCQSCNLKIEKDQPWLYDVINIRVPDTSTKGEHYDNSTSPISSRGLVSNSSLSSLSEINEKINKHPWFHDLVLITKPEPEKKSLSIEERLMNLEERVDKQNVAMDCIRESVENIEKRVGMMEHGQEIIAGESKQQLGRLENMLQQIMNLNVPQPVNQL